jgi:hypothetical protein
MSSQIKPIGSAAVTLAAPLQTASSRGSVISSLANGILSNYGKILLLVGALCFLRYVVTHRRSSGLQNLEPSSSLPQQHLKEAREIIRELARHEDVLVPLEKKIPGIIAQIQENLTSSNMDDVLGCKKLLIKESRHHNQYAAIKLGENPWILPKGRRKLGHVKFDYGGIVANNQVCRTILGQLKLQSSDALPFDSVSIIHLVIENNQVTAVQCRKEDESKIGEMIKITSPVAIDFVKAPERLPNICPKYTPDQRLFAQILINTLWKLDQLDPSRDHCFADEDFSGVLTRLKDLCDTAGSPNTLRIGNSTFKSKAEDINPQFFTVLLTSIYVKNLHTPHCAVFHLNTVMDHLTLGGIKITDYSRSIYLKHDDYTRFCTSIDQYRGKRDITYPAEADVRQIYLGPKTIDFICSPGNPLTVMMPDNKNQFGWARNG